MWIGGSTTDGLPTTPNAPNPDYLGGPTDGFLVRIAVTDRIQSVPPGGFGLLNGAPLVTYTGDANRNSVLDVEFANNLGQAFAITTESNFSDDEAPVAGCGDEPRIGITGSINVFDPTTGKFINVPGTTPGENCLPDGDILDLAEDPFFIPNDLAGSGFVFTGNDSDGTVIQIDTGGQSATGGGANLELSKRLSPTRTKSFTLTEISSPRDTRTFSIHVFSKGPDSAINVRVTDSLPAGFTVKSIESFGGPCTQAGGEITCDLGTMPPKTGRTITIQGDSPGDVGDYINTALAKADNLIGPTRIATAELKVRPFVPLKLSKTVVEFGANRIEYRIEVKNQSADKEAPNVKVDDILPSELLGVEFEISRGKCDHSAPSPSVPTALNRLDCTLGVLPAGETWVIRVRGFPKDLRAEIYNRVTSESDQAGSSDFDSTTNEVEGTPSTDMRHSFYFWTPGSSPGNLREVRQDVPAMCKGLDATVFNQGFDDATGVQLEIDQISSANLRTIDPLCSVSGTRLNCNVGDVAAFSSKQLGFLVCAEDEPEIARFRGVVTAATPDPDPTNDLDRAAAVLDDSVENVRIAPGGIVSSSGFHRPLVISPGSDPSLFGEGLADETIVATTVPLPLELGGVRVELKGIPAPLIFVSPNQINFQTPWELQADTKAEVVVRKNGDESLPAKVFISSFNPGIFTTTQTGSGQAAVLIAGTASVAAPEGSIPGAAMRPVKIGEFISIFATGLGAVDNRPTTGDVSPAGPLARTKTNPIVTIGGVEAGLTFSGLAPGFVGLYQVNAEIAAGTPVGDAVELVLSSGLVPSNAVTIAVAPQ